MQLGMPPYVQHNSEGSAQDNSSPQELSAPVQHAWQSESLEQACISAEHTSGGKA